MKMNEDKTAAWRAEFKAFQEKWNRLIPKSSEKADTAKLKEREAELHALAKKHGVETTTHTRKAITLGGVGLGFHPCPDPDPDSILAIIAITFRRKRESASTCA